MADPSEKDPSPSPTQPPSVYDYIAAMIQQLAHLCWQKLGVQPDSMTGAFEKDFAEAKAAIDAVAGLAKVLETQLDEDDRRQLHSLIRDLRINFVQKSTEAGS